MVLRPRGRGRVGRRRPPMQDPGATRPEARGSCASRTPGPTPAHDYPSSRMTRAGIATVVGKPNAGKSTLLNRLVGQKLSITSPKPQSTRNLIVGIHSDDLAQIIFFDTPG